MRLLSEVGIIGGWLFIAACAALVLLVGLCVSADRRDERQERERTATQPSRIMPELGDDTLTMLCRCCTGRPMEFADCTCRENCGVTWCQADDPEFAGTVDLMEREWRAKWGGSA